MNFLSLFSGIEAASVAFNPLGWEAVGFSEIEPFACAVLAHHYPNVPNFGDITKYETWPEFTNIDVVCGGSPCQSFSVTGKREGLDSQNGQLMLTYLAVVQRYKPRFVLWENITDNSRKGIATTGRGDQTFGTLMANCGTKQWLGNQEAFSDSYHIVEPVYPLNTQAMQGRPADNNRMGSGIGKDGDPAPTLTKMHSHAVAYGVQGNVIDREPHNGGNGLGVSEEESPTLTKNDRHAVAFIGGIDHENNGHLANEPTGPLMKGSPSGGGRPLPVAIFQDETQSIVRRLMPVECARLQGFPGDYLDILYRGKPATDTPKYQALGNSWAVPVVSWLAKRIAMVNEVLGGSGND